MSWGARNARGCNYPSQGGEMKESPLRNKSYEFSLKIVRLIRGMRERKPEYELTSQLLRAATSVGGNIEEAGAGQSRRDFIAKLSIARKEANESRYWLRLMCDADVLEKSLALKLIGDCEDLIRMLAASIKTAQRSAART
jgi:four helix bundle protein